MIAKCKKLKVLDFRKVKQQVRDQQAVLLLQCSTLLASLLHCWGCLLMHRPYSCQRHWNPCLTTCQCHLPTQERQEAERVHGADAAVARPAAKTATFDPDECLAAAHEAAGVAAEEQQGAPVKKGPTPAQLTAIQVSCRFMNSFQGDKMSHHAQHLLRSGVAPTARHTKRLPAAAKAHSLLSQRVTALRRGRRLLAMLLRNLGH